MDVSNHPIDFESMLKFSAEFSGDPISGMSVLEKQFGLLQINNVYHYTDISGFISIMENHELWASHIAFMNDKSEYLHGKELFRERILQKIANVSEPEKQVLQNIIKSLDKEISDGVFPISSKDVFSISFSYNRDSLEMWRGYGKESGVAIGFDFSQCHSLPGMCLIRKEMYEKLLEQYNNIPENVCPNYEHRFLPISVLYEDEKKLELVDQAIDMGLTCFNNQAKSLVEIATIAASDFLSDLIFRLNPQLKHRGFSGEAECRFVDNSVKRSDEAYRIHYRNRGGIVLPYVKYKLTDLNCRPLSKIPICEIVVGPGLKQSKTIDSIKYFLGKNQMSYLVNKVHASDIPYIET